MKHRRPSVLTRLLVAALVTGGLAFLLVAITLNNRYWRQLESEQERSQEISRKFLEGSNPRPAKDH